MIHNRERGDAGRRGEDIACQKLREMGFRILERNVRRRYGEIDIVAEDAGTICFVEVRTRRNTDCGHPAETITAAKQRNIRRAAEAYLASSRIGSCALRFDVVTIVWDSMEIQVFRNAFGQTFTPF